MKKTYRATFDMEIDVIFHSPEKSKKFFMDGSDWSKVFESFESLEELVESLAGCFYSMPSSYEDGQVSKHIEGYSPFIRQADFDSWLSEDEGYGNITVIIEMDLDVDSVYERETI